MHCNQLESIDNYKKKDNYTVNSLKILVYWWVHMSSSFISVAVVKYTDKVGFRGEKVHLSLQVLVTSQQGGRVAGL